MVVEYNQQKFLTDGDLDVKILGSWPRQDIKNERLKKYFEENFGQSFLGGDELIAYAQSLVSHGMDFELLENEILADIENPEKGNFKDVLFKKTASGIGKGHSLGGLSGVVLGIHGTKMIDSGLTGLVSSRSLVTSSRRRETTTGDIVIPEKLMEYPEVFKEYLEISQEVFNLSKEFKEKFGEMAGVETFNKVIPYNNPADLFIVLPLDTMSTIVSEVREDKLNPNGNFLPREVHNLAYKFHEITKEIGQNIMLRQRIEVPRDTYFHYNVFKDPTLPNSALEEGKMRKMPLEPLVIDSHKNFTDEFKRGLKNLKELFERTQNITEPAKLHEESLRCMYALRNFTGEFNEAVRIKISDSLSWRVWSEQKRHATLRQNVESVYSAAERAYQGVNKLWPIINKAHEENDFEKIKNILGDLEKNIIIDERLKKKPELIIPYVYHTARQLMFYGKMIEKGFESGDALYIVPKNIRVRTLENYDLTNLTNLELPLRLCGTCEPERQFTSWKKREVILNVVPELEFLIQPKCNVGFCTEGKPCAYIKSIRDYDMDLHKGTKEVMLDEARK